MLDYDISSCPLFTEIDRAEQKAFLNRLVSNRKIVEKGETLARQGDEIKHLYLLISSTMNEGIVISDPNTVV